MTHLYWTIVCKNERCGMRHEIEYIGESLNLGTVHEDNKNPRTITCEHCGETHAYPFFEWNLFVKTHPPDVAI